MKNAIAMLWVGLGLSLVASSFALLLLAPWCGWCWVLIGVTALIYFGTGERVIDWLLDDSGDYGESGS